MVHFYVFNPAQKLRLMSRLIIRGSKRILKYTSGPASSIPNLDQPNQPKFNVANFIKGDLRHIPQGGLTRDPVYYRDDSEGGFCVFRVENTLFKVHKCFLLREPSVFQDMFGLPMVEGNVEGLSDDSPIPLSDTAAQFQDLLSALYAVPSQLYSANEAEWPSLEQLFNVAELANKYCIASYESWALDRILILAQKPNSFLRHASADICARALDIAALCDHQNLIEVISRRLISRVLWSIIDHQPILIVAQNRGLRKLQGVTHYRELIEIEKASCDGTSDLPLKFPALISNQKRNLFRSARNSLINLYECIRTTPPIFVEDACSSHSTCLSIWNDLWLDAGLANETVRHGSADVLGKLKSMMILLKNSVNEAESLSLGCALAALESITSTRDEIINGLMDHFQED